MPNSSYQVILEIRFNQNLKFRDNKFIEHISSILASNGYQFKSSNGNIEGINNSNGTHFSINPIRCGIDYNTNNIQNEEFKKNMLPIIDSYKLLEIGNLNRIGLRIISSNKYDTIIDATNKIKDILQIKNNNLETLKSECDTCNISFNKKIKGYNVRITINPNQVNVDIAGFNQQINLLSLDIDISQNNINVENKLDTKYENFLNEVKQLQDKYKDIF